MSDVRFWAIAEAVMRGLKFAGQLDPLEGHIIRRIGDGAIVFTDYVGQDEDGSDLFAAVGYVIWE
jgi:hypothetical protein